MEGLAVSAYPSSRLNNSWPIAMFAPSVLLAAILSSELQPQILALLRSLVASPEHFWNPISLGSHTCLEWGGDDHPWFRKVEKAEAWGQKTGKRVQTSHLTAQGTCLPYLTARGRISFSQRVRSRHSHCVWSEALPVIPLGFVCSSIRQGHAWRSRAPWHWSLRFSLVFTIDNGWSFFLFFFF